MQQEVSADEVDALAHRAHAAGARVILNAAPVTAVSSELLRHIDMLIVNDDEATR